MAMIHEITKLVGKHKPRKRIGRGPGSGTGKTAGRGHKGAGSRSGFGGSINALYEGGQTPFFRRIPKRGFSNARFRTEYNIINLRSLEARFNDGDIIDRQALAQAGLIRHKDYPVKILGEGELTRKLTVTADKFSGSARQKIESAGGTVQVIEKKPPRVRSKPRPQAAAPPDDAEADADLSSSPVDETQPPSAEAGGLTEPSDSPAPGDEQ